MGRFSNLVSKAGEIVQQANQEYQKSKQRQHQQQQRQPQPQRQHGQHGQQGQQGQIYGQQQYGAQSGQEQYTPQYGQPQQYDSQAYNPQQPVTSPSAQSSWQQYQPQPQYNQQPLYTQHPTQPPPPPQYDASQIHHAAEHALAQLKAEQQQAEQQQAMQLRQQLAAEQAALERQTEADRQYAERLAAQDREEAERESREAEAELRRLRTEAAEQQGKADEMLREQECELRRQMEQLQLMSGPPPPTPPRPQGSADFPPPMPPRPTGRVPGVTSPGPGRNPALTLPVGEIPPPVPMASRPGIIHGAGRSSEGAVADHGSTPPALGPHCQQQEIYPASMNPFKQGQIPASTETTYQTCPPPPVRQTESQPISQVHYSHTPNVPTYSNNPVSPSVQLTETQFQQTCPLPGQQVEAQSPSSMAFSPPPGPPPQPQNLQSPVVHSTQTTGTRPLQQGDYASTNPFLNQPTQQSHAPLQAHSDQESTPQQSHISPPSQLSAVNTRPRPIPQPPRYLRTPPPPQFHACGVKPMAECADDLITYDMDWFYHPDAPSFFICPRCYVDHIWETQFSTAFRRELFTDQKPRRCLFGSQRVKEQLWPGAVSSGHMDSAIEFFKYASTLGDCPQANIQENESWYTCAEIPGMTMCKACFENGLVGTPFARHFRMKTVPQAFCDSSVWSIKRLYDDHIEAGNWAAFVQGAKVRIQIPACPKQAVVKASERVWYKSKRGPEALQVCEACYYDYFHASPDQTTFHRVPGGNFNTSCVLGHLNIIIPLHQAITKKDREIFWRAIDGVDAQPFCDKKGIRGATWYTLPSNPPEFGLCGGCYAGIVQTIGGSKLFVPKRGVSQNDMRLCCFNLGHSRAAKYLAHYSESLLKSDPGPLSDFALRFGSVPPCQRRHLRGTGGRRAWGWGSAAICEECYLTFAQGTSLESRFVLRGQRDAPGHERMCDLYSPRMRDLYTRACQTGDLEGFLAQGEHRHRVWCETIPACENILSQQKIAAMQAQTLGVSGTFYKAMGGAVDATQGHWYTVGNSYAGYGHANEWMLQGHMYDRQSREAAAAVTSPGNMMQISMLEQRWAEVE